MANTVSSRAKQALSTASPDEIVGRDDQLAIIRKFIDDAFAKSKASKAKKTPLKARNTPNKKTTEDTEGKKVKRSLYISGAPGTGKTACLNYVLRETQENHGFETVFINCMSLKATQDVFDKVSEQLGIKETVKVSKAALEKVICGTRNILVVLDEIDQLSSKCQEVLYSIFEWPYLKGSKLVLVGIANALDLTDRILPRLKVNILQKKIFKKNRTNRIFFL